MLLQPMLIILLKSLMLLCCYITLSSGSLITVSIWFFVDFSWLFLCIKMLLFTSVNVYNIFYKLAVKTTEITLLLIRIILLQSLLFVNAC